MSELPTIAIVSPKIPGERWVINLQDFDPKKHVRWEDRVDAATSTTEVPNLDVVEATSTRRRGRR